MVVFSNTLKAVSSKQIAIAEVKVPSVKNGGVSFTPTFNPSSPGQSLPNLPSNPHIRNLMTERLQTKAADLVQTMMRNDPDVSAAVSAYSTLADTKMRYLVRDADGQIDYNGQQVINAIMKLITTPSDYTKGFVSDKSLHLINQDLRYMLLMRGSIGAELVFNKGVPTELRLVDTANLTWVEKTPGKLSPTQEINGQKVSLDLPSFFYTTHLQDPTHVDSQSIFISVINTVYARYELINDLYKILRKVGYPRVHIKLLQDAIMKNAPKEVKMDTSGEKLQAYFQNIQARIGAQYQLLEADSPVVTTDAIEASILSKDPGAALNIIPIIDVLNAQNQAALKVVSSVLGRGSSGVNTASIESRVFLMTAHGMNKTIARIWEQALNFALRYYGSLSYVEVSFEMPELRPESELMPAMVQKHAVYLEDLSLGLIPDDKYHLDFWGVLPPKDAPKLSGTGFNSGAGATPVDSAHSVGYQGNQPDPAQKQANNKADKSANSKQVK